MQMRSTLFFQNKILPKISHFSTTRPNQGWVRHNIYGEMIPDNAVTIIVILKYQTVVTLE